MDSTVKILMAILKTTSDSQCFPSHNLEIPREIFICAILAEYVFWEHPHQGL